MLTPYDWQEGIGNRAQYIEGKLAQGSPVLAVSLDEGIVLFTYRRQARKIYEIYDRIIFSGVGQQADVEAIRNAALEFASREAFQRSDDDVTIQRVATSMSAPLKRAFGDFSTAPLVARCIFGEISESAEQDVFYTLDYDGDYAVSRKAAAIAGTLETGEALELKLRELSSSTPLDEVLVKLDTIWHYGIDPDGKIDAEELTRGLKQEAILLERSDARDNRFRLLTPEEF